jgi:hypothetical protein
MKSSLPLLPLLLAVIVLSGCPDSKLPKVPPQVPEPKAVVAGPPGAIIDAAPASGRVYLAT